MTPFELDAIFFSARVGVLTVALCFPLALMMASWTGRRGGRWRWLMDALLLLPLALSPAVIGWGVASLLTMQRLAPHALVLASACLVLPLMVRTMRPAFEAVDHKQVMAARTLGASRWSAWWTITVAQARPLLLSATVLGFAAAWGETGAVVMLLAAMSPDMTIDLAGPATTASLSLLGAMQTGQDKGMALRLSLVALALAALTTLASEWARQRWRRRALPLGARGTHR